MGFKVSPQIGIYEKQSDALSIDPISLAIGAQCGTSQWGPVSANHLIRGGETEFKAKFGTPTKETIMTYLIAQDFMRYSKRMYFNRVVGPKARNSATKFEVAIPCANGSNIAEILMVNVPDAMSYPDSLEFEVNGVLKSFSTADESLEYALIEFFEEQGLMVVVNMFSITLKQRNQDIKRIRMRALPEEQNAMGLSFGQNPSASVIDGWQTCCLKPAAPSGNKQPFFSYLIQQDMES